MRTKNQESPKAPARVARVAVLFFVLAPFVAALLYVRSYGVNVFYADEWDFVALLRESSRDTLGAADLFARHNEHIYFFPWGLMLLLGSFTDYNTVPLMYLVVACLLITSLTILCAHEKTAGRSFLACLLFAPTPLLLFSFRQHENLLWGNQISFGVAQTFSVLALYLLRDRDSGRFGKLAFITAAVCAAVASFSAAPGLLVWPAGLLLLMLAPTREELAERGPAVGAWVLASLAVWGGYLVGYGGFDSPQSPLFVLGHPAAGAEYLLTLFGGALFWREGTAMAVGALLVLLFIATLALALALGRAKHNAFWISLGAFSLLSLALITAGRSGLGDAVFARAILSRYAAFSILGVVALHGLLVSLALEARSRIAVGLLGALLVAMLAGTVHSYPRGMAAGREIENSRMQAARILSDHKTEPLAAFTIFGHEPGRVQRYARFLERREYGIFGESEVRETPYARSSENSHALRWIGEKKGRSPL